MTSRQGSSFYIVLIVFCLGLAPTLAGAGDEVLFDDEHWQLRGEVVDHLGQRALRGGASLSDVLLADGIIEVDLAVDGRRGFPGIRFRLIDEQNTEMFYVRPHRSQGYSHALQYTPVFNGMSAWQLYCGKGFTAAADIPWDEWIHIKIELAGSRARIYFGDMERPALVVENLIRDHAAGGIALTGRPDGGVHWANFRYQATDKLDFGLAPLRAPTAGMIRDWEISQSFLLASLDRMLAPSKASLGEIKWQKIEPEPSGLANFSRLIAMSGRMPECVFARTTIAVDSATVKRLDFGYSDDITVYLNGRPLFFGESSFRTRDSEFVGVVGLNDSLFLNLDKGSNELVFSIAEGFGGWGFMARLSDAQGGVASLAEGVNPAWGMDEGLGMPESVTIDEERGVIYVSNMTPARSLRGATGPDPDAGGFVAKLGLDGTVQNLQWATGLNRPTGAALSGDRLLVVERTGLAVVDTATGEVAERYTFNGAAGFLNDVAVDSAGTAFVTDSGTGVIYEVSDGEFREWLRHDALAGANGVCVDGAKLLIGADNGGSLVTIDRESRAIERIIDLSPCASDGVTSLGDGRVLISDYRGRLLLVEPSGAFTVLVDTSRSAVGCADFGFAPKSKLVVIPSLFGNTLAAYKLELLADSR